MCMTVVRHSHARHGVGTSFVLDISFGYDIASDLKIARALCQRSVYCHRGRCFYRYRTGNTFYPDPVSGEIDFPPQVIKNTNFSALQISGTVTTIGNNHRQSLIPVSAQSQPNCLSSDMRLGSKTVRLKMLYRFSYITSEKLNLQRSKFSGSVLS